MGNLGIILAILLFSFIVFFHELGHFLLAKKNGIDVDEFAIGMGPAIYSKEYRDQIRRTYPSNRRVLCDGGR